MEQEPLAMELLKEVKASAKRWFICFIIMVALEVATIFGFIVYVSLPVDTETTTTTQEVQQDTEGDGNNSFVGGDNYGKATD